MSNNSDFEESELLFVRDFDDDVWRLYHYIGRTANGCFMCVSEDSHEDFCNGGFYCQIFIQGRKAFDYEVTQYREDMDKKKSRIVKLFKEKKENLDGSPCGVLEEGGCE